MAAFAGLLVTAALTYSLRYFDAVEGLFHGLMLLFMAGMVGFCLTGDLFNLVVFFEVMSAAAFALTAYKIEEKGPIQGAINFAITNSIAGYTMFIAVGLLYARTGALNMAQIGAALGSSPPGPAGHPGHGPAVRRLPDQGRRGAAALLARRRPRRGTGPGVRALLRRHGRARDLRGGPALLAGVRRPDGRPCRHAPRDLRRPGRGHGAARGHHVLPAAPHQATARVLDHQPRRALHLRHRAVHEQGPGRGIRVRGRPRSDQGGALHVRRGPAASLRDDRRVRPPRPGAADVPWSGC